MIIDYRGGKDELPKATADALTGLRAETLECLQAHFMLHGIEKNDVDEICLGEGYGFVGDKCEWAAEISRRFNCTVRFFHNETPVISHPSVAAAALATWYLNNQSPSQAPRDNEIVIRLPDSSLREIEIQALKLAFRISGGKVIRAAKLLGITRHTLRRKLEKFGLQGLRQHYGHGATTQGASAKETPV